jgi:CheY-like chemotaxis protein
MAVRCLTQLGYQVTAATCGDDALRVFDEHEGRFDLLFTDMVMTGKLTGLTLCLRLQAISPGLRAIITSGYSVELARGGPDATAAQTFLPKPYTFAGLASTVRGCLDGPPPTG